MDGLRKTLTSVVIVAAGFWGEGCIQRRFVLQIADATFLAKSGQVNVKVMCFEVERGGCADTDVDVVAQVFRPSTAGSDEIAVYDDGTPMEVRAALGLIEGNLSKFAELRFSAAIAPGNRVLVSARSANHSAAITIVEEP